MLVQKPTSVSICRQGPSVTTCAVGVPWAGSERWEHHPSLSRDPYPHPMPACTSLASDPPRSCSVDPLIPRLHEISQAGSYGLFLDAKKTEVSDANTEAEPVKPEGVVVNGKEEEPGVDEALSKGLGQMTTTTDTDGDSYKDKTESVTSGPLSPEGSPSKSPSKKKKKFRTPSFLKKSKKKEKVES